MALDSLLCKVFPFDSQERFARKYYELQMDIKQGLQTLATDVATQITGTRLGDALFVYLMDPVARERLRDVLVQTNFCSEIQPQLAG